ncbi:hypothetical protein X739_08745 [Mesorhizobium sp. LNHC220B00]|nr:hypothetical protein X739_08745 [Mesorhizobium sp. LNHC220B00]
MGDEEAATGAWRIGNFFVADDKLEHAVHERRRLSRQMQPALSGTGQWRSG